MKETPRFESTIEYIKALTDVIKVSTDWDLKKKCEEKIKEILDMQKITN